GGSSRSCSATRASRRRRCTQRSHPLDCVRYTRPPIRELGWRAEHAKAGDDLPGSPAVGGAPRGNIRGMAETTSATRRAQLQAEHDRVTGQLLDLGVDRDFDEGFADSGQVTAERGEVQALAGTLRENLQDIDAALGKMDQGTYGLCESCGRPISDARLEAMPAARLCIACASKRR